MPYSDSRRLIDAKDLNIIISAKDYYNIIRKEISNKSKPKIIITFFKILENNDFIYRIRVNIEEDKSSTIIAYKLI